MIVRTVLEFILRSTSRRVGGLGSTCSCSRAFGFVSIYHVHVYVNIRLDIYEI